MASSFNCPARGWRNRASSMVQRGLMGEGTREDTRHFRGSHRHRDVEGMGRETHRAPRYP
eukprot:2819459-Pyramimonas_sp.AAC.1